MLDNDVILPQNALVEMCRFLQSHLKYSAIGLPKYDLPEVEQGECLHALHVDMSCILFRREILNQIKFFYPPKDGDHPSGGRCECAICCWDIRQMGFEIGYLPGFKAEHIPNTKKN